MPGPIDTVLPLTWTDHWEAPTTVALMPSAGSSARTCGREPSQRRIAAARYGPRSSSVPSSRPYRYSATPPVNRTAPNPAKAPPSGPVSSRLVSGSPAAPASTSMIGWARTAARRSFSASVTTSPGTSAVRRIDRSDGVSRLTRPSASHASIRAPTSMAAVATTRPDRIAENFVVPPPMSAQSTGRPASADRRTAPEPCADSSASRWCPAVTQTKSPAQAETASAMARALRWRSASPVSRTTPVSTSPGVSMAAR